MTIPFPRKMRIQFSCCFCGEAEADIGLASTDMQTGEFRQQWWCHKTCLFERMVPQARVDPEEE